MLRKINLNRILLNLNVEKPIRCLKDFKTHLNIILDLKSIFKCFFVSLITISNLPTFVPLFGLVLGNEITSFTVHALNPGVFLIFVYFHFPTIEAINLFYLFWCCVSFQFDEDRVFFPTLVTRRQHFQWYYVIWLLTLMRIVSFFHTGDNQPIFSIISFYVTLPIFLCYSILYIVWINVSPDSAL